jgi:ADP-ribose pyrophosphatase YjhB (NUDIX family)
MKYCSDCGAPVSLRIPQGDHLPRHICDKCGAIHYQNPKIVAGCIAHWGERILLCRRAIEPRYGLWTLPAGFMENGETTLEAAARETWEEARARVAQLTLYGLFNLPHINQVYVMFRGEVLDGEAEAGPESLEVGLFAESEIPWPQLAFPVVRESLHLYLDDRRNGTFPMRMSDVRRLADQSVQIHRHSDGAL